MNQTDKNSQRLTDLETSLMHLQKDFELIDEVVLDLAGRIDQLTKLLERLTERFEADSAGEPQRSAEDEKPPHY